MEQCFIEKLYQMRFKGLPFLASITSARVTEAELVCGVLRMLQGFSSSIFYWDDSDQGFKVKEGTHVAHLSMSSLNNILSQFIYTSNCLQLIENLVKHVRISSPKCPPTVKAFMNCVFERLKNLRMITLREEEKSTKLEHGSKTTLLELVENLKCVCAGAQSLLHIVREVIPCNYFAPESSVKASEMVAHILDYLYLKLNEVSLVQDGEDGMYHMLLILFIGSLQPLIQGLDSWLYEGILDDPFEELFFYANDAIRIDEAAFWKKGYILRQLVSHGIAKPTFIPGAVRQEEFGGLSLEKPSFDTNKIACPIFLQTLAKSIVSAGKSLQLLRHVPKGLTDVYGKDERLKCSDFYNSNSFCSKLHARRDSADVECKVKSFLLVGDKCTEPVSQVKQILHTKGIGGLTLSELFCTAFVALVGDDDHLCKYFGEEYPWSPEIARICNSYIDEETIEDSPDSTTVSTLKGISWCTFLLDTVLQVRVGKMGDRVHKASEVCSNDDLDVHEIMNSSSRNPSLTVCCDLLEKNHKLWEKLNISTYWFLPPLNDWSMREAIFGTEDDFTSTNYLPCLGLSDSFHSRVKYMEGLYPFPTLLPCCEEDSSVMGFLPYQKNSTVASRVLSWIKNFEHNKQLLPVVIVQECLLSYIKKQVDYVGKQILLKLMNSWRLLDELSVLHAIYLLGSGDLLQQFSAVLFNKLDEGEPWDDYFELNTMLQDSIRNSADGALLSSPNSLVVTILKNHKNDEHENQSALSQGLLISNSHCYGINALDMLDFTYKVSWPLEVIANQDAMRRYNQVLAFLLKVKRAKFVLDKTRRWMWKDRGSSKISNKRHLLPQQKLLHFVDAFHQYVMDRVLHSAWLELSEGMISARSLDEVIEVHESYLMSIQRQCFVAPDKLLALIASRIKSILGLALDFHSIQHTLYHGGAASSIKARCEMEVDHIEKQFDECISFLLKVLSSKTNVGHFPHLADLVTRINYNYYYMSEDGSLLSVLGVEAVPCRLVSR